MDIKKLKPEGMVRRFSETFIQRQQSTTPYPKKSTIESKDLLELIHIDVCGPMTVPSINGSTFFISFIDDNSRYTKVYFLKSKNEVEDVF